MHEATFMQPSLRFSVSLIDKQLRADTFAPRRNKMQRTIKYVAYTYLFIGAGRRFVRM